MYSIYLRGKVYMYICARCRIGVRLSTWYVRYNNAIFAPCF